MHHTTVTDVLEAADGYMLYVTIIVGMILFHSPTSRLIAAIGRRVRGGSGLKAFGVELTALVEKTEDARLVARAKGEELKVFGDPDQFKLLFKAQGSHWAKSTKAMAVPGGCLVLVTSERQSIDGDWSTAESLELIPGAALVDNDGRFELVPG